MHRCLRMTAVVLLGLGGVTLIVFWVRSYEWREIVYGRNPDIGSFYVISMGGQVRVGLFRERRTKPDDFSRWGVNSSRPHELPRPDSPLQHSALGFGISTFPNALVVAFPYSFLVLATGALAVLAMTKRTLRFRLRTLLIVMTMAAVGLGLLVMLIRRG